MTDARSLVVIGEAPFSTLAAAIGVSERGPSQVLVLDLTPDRIADDMLDGLHGHPPESTDVFAAIGVSALNYARFDLWAKLRLRGYRCAALVHPTAIVDPSAKLGDNVLVGAGVIVEPGAEVGRGTFIASGAVVGSNAKIGAWCLVASRAVVGVGASVGPHSVIGSGVHLADGTEFPGPGEITTAGTYRGTFAPGTFIASGFPIPGARLVRGD